MIEVEQALILGQIQRCIGPTVETQRTRMVAEDLCAEFEADLKRCKPNTVGSLQVGAIEQGYDQILAYKWLAAWMVCVDGLNLGIIGQYAEQSLAAQTEAATTGKPIMVGVIVKVAAVAQAVLYRWIMRMAETAHIVIVKVSIGPCRGIGCHTIILAYQGKLSIDVLI